MKNYKTEGIVIRKIKYKEADEIITLFSKHYGKIIVIAKGIRKPISRKRGNLELANLAFVNLAEGRTWDIVTEAEVKNSFKNLKTDLKKSVYVFQILEIVDKLTVEEQVGKEVYFLLKEFLEFLDEIRWENIELVMSSFSIKILSFLGFWEISEVQSVSFLSEKDKKRLQKLEKIEFSEILKFKVEEKVEEDLKKVVNKYLELILESELRSDNLIKRVNQLERSSSGIKE